MLVLGLVKRLTCDNIFFGLILGRNHILVNRVLVQGMRYLNGNINSGLMLA